MKQSIRLDKYLANLGLIPRRQLKKLLKQWIILINDIPAWSWDQKLSLWDKIQILGVGEFKVKKDIHLLFYKPKGYVSTDVDEPNCPSYKNLLADYPYVNLLHAAWRLDCDAHWLLLLSSDGNFIHQIISPKSKVEKEYEVELKDPITQPQIDKLQKWVTLDDGYKTLPAQVKLINPQKIKLTIHEGKYHQVKRMLETVGNKVIDLKRIRIGQWELGNLKPGERQEI